MSEQERIRLLLDMQEHPGNYSDEQLERLLADEEMAALFEEVALTKRAMVSEELKVKSEALDLWSLATEGTQEFASAPDNGVHAAAVKSSIFNLRFSIYKVAASIVGMVIVSGIAFAAIYSLTPSPSPKGEGSSYIQTSDTIRQSSLPLEGTGKSTPVVYDNTPLERMLPEIGVHYGVEVVFENDDVRGLRFRFVWHPERGIEQVVGDLNQFERLTVTLKDHQITVE